MSLVVAVQDHVQDQNQEGFVDVRSDAEWKKCVKNAKNNVNITVTVHVTGTVTKENRASAKSAAKKAVKASGIVAGSRQQKSVSNRYVRLNTPKRTHEKGSFFREFGICTHLNHHIPRGCRHEIF